MSTLQLVKSLQDAFEHDMPQLFSTQQKQRSFNYSTHHTNLGRTTPNPGQPLFINLYVFQCGPLASSYWWYPNTMNLLWILPPNNFLILVGRGSHRFRWYHLGIAPGQLLFIEELQGSDLSSKRHQGSAPCWLVVGSLVAWLSHF